MGIVASEKLRVGWGSFLGTTIGILFELTPSSTGAPLSDMTTVMSVSIRVERGDRFTILTWPCTLVSATPELATWSYVFSPTDLVEPETLSCTALMTTPGGVVPSKGFELHVDE